jgi:hypothetical protein
VPRPGSAYPGVHRDRIEPFLPLVRVRGARPDEAPSGASSGCVDRSARWGSHMDGGRRCALPGCDERIPRTDGRPERRYCTAAHRLVARRARRAGRGAERPDEPLAPALPWVHEPAVEPAADRHSEPGWWPAPPPSCSATTRSTHHRRAPARPFGRRALVLLGVAGLLVGGYALSDAAAADAARDVVGVVGPGGDPEGGGGRERDNAALREELVTGRSPAGDRDAASDRSGARASSGSPTQRPDDPATVGQPSDAGHDGRAARAGGAGRARRQEGAGRGRLTCRTRRRNGSGAATAAWRLRSPGRHRYRHPL